MQNSFLAAYRQLGDYRGEASFKTWLYGIALNECRMVHRRSGRTTSLEDVAEPAAPASGAHALDRVTLRKLVARLPEKQRMAVVLRVCDDLSFREIGEAVGSSEASAKVNFFHAVQKLRAWVLPARTRPRPGRGVTWWSTLQTTAHASSACSHGWTKRRVHRRIAPIRPTR